jgi:hypothetical protein
MPKEKEGDGGWKPGPSTTAVPTFRGPKCGPTDPLLKHDTPAHEFLRRMIKEDDRRWIVDMSADHLRDLQSDATASGAKRQVSSGPSLLMIYAKNPSIATSCWPHGSGLPRNHSGFHRNRSGTRRNQSTMTRS